MNFLLQRHEQGKKFSKGILSLKKIALSCCNNKIVYIKFIISKTIYKIEQYVTF